MLSALPVGDILHGEPGRGTELLARAAQLRDRLSRAGLATGAYTLSEIPVGLYLLTWVPSVLAAFLIMRKPLTATIDGNPIN